MKDNRLSSSIAGDDELAFERVVSFFEWSRPYLCPTARSEDIASSLMLDKGTLSRIIKEFTDMNFCEFINSYRIEHAAKLLKEDTSISLREACFKSGFGSQQIFNNAFRVHKGKCPAAWRKENTGISGNSDAGLR
jgi:AraC-like DNA-binding protein